MEGTRDTCDDVSPLIYKIYLQIYHFKQISNLIFLERKHEKKDNELKMLLRGN